MEKQIELYLQRTYEILIDSVPILVVLFIVTIVLFKINKILFKNIHKLSMRSAHNLDKIQTKEYEKRVDTLTSIGKTILDIIVIIVMVMIFLKKIGIEIAPLLTGAGIIGIAIGFGSQELVKDMISGLFLLMENHIRAGDVVEINGKSGLVEKIGLRTIILRDFAGVVHIFQNGKIDTLSNMTKDWSAMMFEIGVAYKEDVDHVMRVMKEVGDELRQDEEYKHKIIEDLEIFGVDKFESSAVIIKARLKTQPIEQWGVGREYRRRLKNKFDSVNIQIPFPQTTLHWGTNIKPLKIDIDKV